MHQGLAKLDDIETRERTLTQVTTFHRRCDLRLNLMTRVTIMRSSDESISTTSRRPRVSLQRVAEADAEAGRLRHERMVLDDEREALDAERREADVAMQARDASLVQSVV